MKFIVKKRIGNRRVVLVLVSRPIRRRRRGVVQRMFAAGLLRRL